MNRPPRCWLMAPRFLPPGSRSFQRYSIQGHCASSAARGTRRIPTRMVRIGLDGGSLMRALRLEYGGNAVAHPLGTVGPVIGVLLGVFVLVQYRAAREELATQEIKTAEIRKSGKRGAPAVRANPRDLEASAQEYKLAQVALQRLSLRWTNSSVRSNPHGPRVFYSLRSSPIPERVS